MTAASYYFPAEWSTWTTAVPDGKQLAVSHGTQTSDVVLISSFR